MVKASLLLALLSIGVAADPLPAHWRDDPSPQHRGHIERAELDGGTWGTTVVRIYLPPQEPNRRYPTLYCCDGQNCFQPGRYGDWQLDEVVDELIAEHRIPPLFVVTVDHPEQRIDAYTPRRIWRQGPGNGHEEGGGAARYLRLLLSIKDTVDRDFSTSPENSAVLGSSLGGLFSLYAAYAEPRAFGRVAAMSPSFWWLGRPGLGELLTSASLAQGPQRIWVDMGSSEDSDPDPARKALIDKEYVDEAQSWLNWLELGAGSRRSFHFQLADGAHHNEAAWHARLPAVLEWLWR